MMGCKLPGVSQCPSPSPGDREGCQPARSCVRDGHRGVCNHQNISCKPSLIYVFKKENASPSASYSHPKLLLKLPVLVPGTGSSMIPKTL